MESIAAGIIMSLPIATMGYFTSKIVHRTKQIIEGMGSNEAE